MKTKIHYLKMTAIIIAAILAFELTDLHSQDYLISFAGTGASTIVDSVKIENLMQGTKLKIKGSDILRLTVVTGIEAMSDNETGRISFYPNPMKDYAKMQFVLPEPGETMVSLYDISGMEITHTKDLLTGGKHVYAINGLKAGIYLAKVNSGRYSCSGRLISSGSQNAGVKIVYENTLALQEKHSDSKGIKEEKIMQFTAGDRLLLKGIAGIHSTVVMDVPTSGKTITFNFIPCTDGDGNNYSIVQIGSAKGDSDSKAVQTWTVENIRTTKYNDGTDIPRATEKSMWNKTTPVYCYYNYDSKASRTYGALYNYYAVSTGKLCPVGWSIPTDSEWTVLVGYLGTESAGAKMKEKGSANWTNNSSGTTNESGFTALPAGIVNYDGSMAGLGWLAYLWSRVDLFGEAWCRCIQDNVDYVLRQKRIFTYGMSIRCLKN
jgi:uncharacterized protein (TIGR02145 family)